MLIGATVLFVLVLTLLAISYLRPTLLRSLTPMGWIIAGGLIMPLPVLIALVTVALIQGETLLPRADGTAPIRIQVVARQWSWEFAYPDQPGVLPTTGTVHIPAGEPVDFVVTGDDVIHSFWIPTLGGKIDAIPGRTNTIRLSADEPGTYRGVCAEYCGVGHANMGFVAEAHAPADYRAALEAAQ